MQRYTCIALWINLENILLCLSAELCMHCFMGQLTKYFLVFEIRSFPEGFRIDGIKQADRDPDKNFKTVRTNQEVAYVLRKHIDYRDETRVSVWTTFLK